MAFVAAMSACVQNHVVQDFEQSHAIGVNGADVYTATGIGDVRVALYTSLVRDLDLAEIADFVSKVIAEGWARDQVAAYERDLWLIAFQGRDVRGGKGERTVALDMIAELCRRKPERTAAMLSLVPEYGSWRDVFVLCAQAHMRAACMDLVVRTFKEESVRDLPTTLLAKWMPREGSAMAEELSGIVLTLASALFPNVRNVRQRLATYRRTISKMTTTLKVVEKDMCGGTWTSIKPGAVPGRCMNLNRKAFLNQKVKGSGERSASEDRKACAANFKAHLEAVLAGKATIKGGSTVFPHTVCRQVIGAGCKHTEESTDEMKALEAQWLMIRDKVKSAGAMGRVVPMCDFSGSMSGIPMDVSMALGILLSEVNHSAFKDCMLSFDSEPHWITFKDGMSLYEKCEEARRHGQGLNTDFEAAMNLVLRRLVEHAVPACEAPEDIVVFTDMGFDQAKGENSAAFHRGMEARGGWATIVESMKRRFAAAGYTMPRLVIWNLRSDYKEYHARANESGVLMLSGWSPSSMKIIMNGISVHTPYEGMRAVLDDERYDAVRAALIC